MSLARGFFVAAGAVDLSGEIEARDLLGLEGALQFGWVDGVVLDGVAGAQHLGVFEAGDRLDDCELHFDRHRGAHAVDVNLVGVQAFGFEEELVSFFVGKLGDLVFDRGAVARADGLDLSAVHGRAHQVLAQDAVRLRRGEGDVAGHLRVVVRDLLGAEAERRRVVVAGLHRELRPVDGASVEARWRASLEAAAAQAERLERFAEQDGGGFAAASGGILLLAAVDESVEKRAGGDDDGLCADGAAVAELDASSQLSVVSCQFVRVTDSH